MRTRTWTVRTLIVVGVIVLAAALSGLSEARADSDSSAVHVPPAVHQVGL
jgi:hypothetical protein